MGCSAFLFKILNPIMKAILKSPFHSIVSNRIMIITFKGRKTGKEYSTPVSYFEEGRLVICFTHGKWWMNIGDGADVNVRIRDTVFEGYGIAIPDDVNQKSENMAKLLKAVPSDAGFYNVKFNENGEPDKDDISRAISDSVMIRIDIRD
jgi:hypothetical protein